VLAGVGGVGVAEVEILGHFAFGGNRCFLLEGVDIVGGVDKLFLGVLCKFNFRKQNKCLKELKLFWFERGARICFQFRSAVSKKVFFSKLKILSDQRNLKNVYSKIRKKLKLKFGLRLREIANHRDQPTRANGAGLLRCRTSSVRLCGSAFLKAPGPRGTAPFTPAVGGAEFFGNARKGGSLLWRCR
jgi:hypothetical protein